MTPGEQARAIVPARHARQETTPMSTRTLWIINRFDQPRHEVVEVVSYRLDSAGTRLALVQLVGGDTLILPLDNFKAVAA